MRMWKRSTGDAVRCRATRGERKARRLALLGQWAGVKGIRGGSSSVPEVRLAFSEG